MSILWTGKVSFFLNLEVDTMLKEFLKIFVIKNYFYHVVT